MENNKLKINDRVKRVGRPGCCGTVKEIREESVISSAKAQDAERPLIVTVKWDNGTQSCFGPEGLEGC